MKTQFVPASDTVFIVETALRSQLAIPRPLVSLLHGSCESATDGWVDRSIVHDCLEPEIIQQAHED